MSNKDVAAALEEIAQLMELSGENPFKIRSYVNGARLVEQLDEDIQGVVMEGRLRELPGIGEALADKIQTLVETGALPFLEELRAQFPDTIQELFQIPNLGPKRIKTLYKELGVDTLAALEEALNAGRIADLKGFGPKMQAKIQEGIEFAHAHAGQYLLIEAEKVVETLIPWLRKEPAVLHIAPAGSYRRSKEVVKDVDLVVASAKPKLVMQRFIEAPGVQRVTNHGDTKSSVVWESGIHVDLRVVSEEAYPYALLHFTGSKEHNVVLRRRAKDRDLKLNEYGLFTDEDKLAPCDDEVDIYKKLGLPYIPPELREDMGEFELEESPELLEMIDIRGVIHSHTTYSDGKDSLAEMVTGAQGRGYEYLHISDHSQSAAYAGGLREADIERQHREIDAINKKLKEFRVIKGIESDIRTDGSLDYEDDILGSFELIVASVHSQLDMTEKEATQRLITAVENPYTHILGHPTGRLLLMRRGFPIHYDKLFDACIANQVAIEINANCRRLDIDWRYIRRGRDKGVLFSIGPDAHRLDALDNMRFGIGIARKGWLEAEHVLNTWKVEDLLAWARKKKP